MLFPKVLSDPHRPSNHHSRRRSSCGHRLCSSLEVEEASRIYSKLSIAPRIPCPTCFRLAKRTCSCRCDFSCVLWAVSPQTPTMSTGPALEVVCDHGWRGRPRAFPIGIGHFEPKQEKDQRRRAHLRGPDCGPLDRALLKIVLKILQTRVTSRDVVGVCLHRGHQCFMSVAESLGRLCFCRFARIRTLAFSSLYLLPTC